LIGPIYVSCIIQKILMSTCHQFFRSSFHFITPIRTLLITNRKRRSLAPYSELRIAYLWTSLHELIRDNGSSRVPKNCSPPNARETKRESREARSGYRITRPRGIRSDRRARTETEREQSNAGEFPTMLLTPSASVRRYHAYPWTRTYNSIYLSLNTFSSGPFYSFSSEYSFMTKYRKFLSFFTKLNCSNISFSLYKFNYLHRILTYSLGLSI
jgi:hypothetical protein